MEPPGDLVTLDECQAVFPSSHRGKRPSGWRLERTTARREMSPDKRGRGRREKTDVSQKSDFFLRFKVFDPLERRFCPIGGDCRCILLVSFLRMNTRANWDLLDAKNKIDCNFFLLYRLFFLSFSFEMLGCCTSQSMLFFLNTFQTPKGALNLNHMLLHFDRTSLKKNKTEISLVLLHLFGN